MIADDKLVKGVFSTPAVANSDLPGLRGLTALRDNRAVLDFTTLKLYFFGPGDVRMSEAIPPGTDVFQLEVAPSGHIVLPCCEYGNQEQAKHSLTLLARDRGTGESSDAEASVPQQEASSSSSGPEIPSPPAHQPRLPFTAYQGNGPRCPAPQVPPTPRL